MSIAIIAREANGLVIGQRESDGYIDATKFCQATGKRWNNYWRNDSTQEYLQALATDLKLEVIVNNPDALKSATALIQVFQGGNSQQGTWVHPEVAIDLGQWASPQFRILVNRWVREWMTKGQVQSTAVVPPQEKADSDGVEQLAEDLVGIIFELIWKSSDAIVNVKNCTSRKQKKLNSEFEKGISKQLLLSLAQEFMGDIGHNAEHQHKQVIKQARLRVDPYREYFIEKLQKWLAQQPQQQMALPPVEEFPVPRTATERRQSVIAKLFDLVAEYGSLDAIPRRKKGRPSANPETDWGSAKLSQMFGVSQNTILAIWDEVDEEIKQHGFNQAKRRLLG